MCIRDRSADRVALRDSSPNPRNRRKRGSRRYGQERCFGVYCRADYVAAAALRRRDVIGTAVHAEAALLAVSPRPTLTAVAGVRAGVAKGNPIRAPSRAVPSRPCLLYTSD